VKIRGACGSVALACALVASTQLACKRSAPDTGADAGAPNAPPPPTEQQAATNDPAFVDPMIPPAHDLPETEAPQGNVDIPTGEVVTPGTYVPGKPVPTDPFEASIAATKSGAVPCFADLPPGEYAATLVLHVGPSGRVSRAEIEPGNVEDPKVIACLQSYAESCSFPPSDGRTLRVEVRVKA
jgi:hypothetical protein